MIDAQNKLIPHITIGVLSVLFVYVLYLFGIRTGRAVGAIPFILLFIILIIGPLVTIWPSISKKFKGNFPMSWRGELGIWFAVWSVIHVLFVFNHREWDVLGYLLDISPWAFGALIAVVMAVILAIFSCRKGIRFLGEDSWKWLQNYFTYVIFWLVAIHVIDRALIRPGFPPTDPLHWVYLIMFFLVIILQISGFIITVKRKKQEQDGER